jgi:hypothetical protein
MVGAVFLVLFPVAILMLYRTGGAEALWMARGLLAVWLLLLVLHALGIAILAHRVARRRR